MSASAIFRVLVAGLPRLRGYAVVACVALLLGGFVVPAGAEGSSIKDDAKQAGHAVGSAVREVGHDAKKIGKEIGHGAKEAGKAIATAAREGGHEFHRAIKGE